MRARIVLGISFAVCMIAACGGTEESASDDSPGNDDAGESSFFDSGTSIGIGTDASFFDDGGVTGFADAGFDGDGGRRHRDGGVGRDGGFGFDGGFFDGGFSSDGGISVSDAGVTPPPPPPDGDGGSQGPRDAGTFTGPVLHDANGVVLGELVSIESVGGYYTIVTSTDYVVQINFDGTYVRNSFDFSGLDCTGTPYLDSGDAIRELLGNTVVFSSSLNSLMIPAGPLTDGAQASSLLATVSSAGDPCSNGIGVGAQFYGWQLVATTAANVGLPDVIAAPLSYP